MALCIYKPRRDEGGCCFCSSQKASVAFMAQDRHSLLVRMCATCFIQLRDMKAEPQGGGE